MSTMIGLPKGGYKVVAGPEAYLSPAAAALGIVLPEEGQRLRVC